MKYLYSSILTITLLICTSIPLYAQFVDVEWLKKNLDNEDLVILHIGPEDQYLQEHIPGAIYLASNEYTSGSEDGLKMYDLPPVADLKQMLESKGVDDGDTVVLYVGTNWISPMTRMYFTMKYLGYTENTLILDGGLPLWKYHGGPTTDEVPNSMRGSFTPKPNPDLLVDINFIKEQLDSPSFNIVDARAEVFYQGIQASMDKKGHLPGAKSLPYTSVWNEGPNGSYTIKTVNELKSLFMEQGLDSDNKEFVIYCHIGQQATSVFTAATLLGLSPKLYDGSMHEWGHGSNNPVEID